MAGYTWDDVGSARLPVEQFVSFVCHCPPSSALYHEINKGWSVTDHLLANLIDIQSMLLWTKSKDAQSKHPRNRPEPLARPGMKSVAQRKAEEKQMTIEQYAKLTGMQINFGEEVN